MSAIESNEDPFGYLALEKASEEAMAAVARRLREQWEADTDRVMAELASSKEENIERS